MDLVVSAAMSVEDEVVGVSAAGGLKNRPERGRPATTHRPLRQKTRRVLRGVCLVSAGPSEPLLSPCWEHDTVSQFDPQEAGTLVRGLRTEDHRHVRFRSLADMGPREHDWCPSANTRADANGLEKGGRHP